MRAIAVVGISGAGKTTMAAALAAKLQVTHIELDAIFHQAHWTPLDDEEFLARVQQAIVDSPGGWTMCGGYRVIDSIRDNQADTIVWLDYSKARVMRQVVARTFRRSVRREVLWNGNRESLGNWFRWDPEHNIIRWTWVKFAERRTQFEAKLADGTWDAPTVHRFRSPADAQRWLDSVAASPTSPAS